MLKSPGLLALAPRLESGLAQHPLKWFGLSMQHVGLVDTLSARSHSTGRHYLSEHQRHSCVADACHGKFIDFILFSVPLFIYFCLRNLGDKKNMVHVVLPSVASIYVWEKAANEWGEPAARVI